MQNLLRFFSKHTVFFLFILLELIAFNLIVKQNNFHRTSFLNFTNNTVAASFHNFYQKLTSYFHLKQVNEDLARENMILRNLISQQAKQVTYYPDSIFVKNKLPHYEFILAKVINNSVIKANNYLTLNAGKNQGIEPDMGVLTTNGIVGIVKNVSDNYATVMSVLHQQTKISAKIKRNNYFGSLVWNTQDAHYGTLLYIPKNVELNKGDTIVSSGLSTIFPENIEIGTIEAFTVDKNEGFYNIKVKFSTNFYNLSYVYVVKNNEKTEQETIENLSQQNE